MTSEKAAMRRQYSAQRKAQVVGECDVPGASVARVAMAHGINANIVHRWRQLARQGASAGGRATPIKAREFVPVAIAAPSVLPAPHGHAIEVELRRGATTMKVLWPISAAAVLAAWTRELLR